jgi:hypothetical protein
MVMIFAEPVLENVASLVPCFETNAAFTILPAEAVV